MLSRKCQYALHALVYFAQQDRTKYTTIGEVSAVRTIPKKFLEAILLELKTAGILGSKNGKGGGYYLRRDPASIQVIEVIRLVDGAVAMLPCVSLNFYESCGMCDDEATCKINSLFSNVRDQTIQILSKATLEDLANRPPGTF